MEEKSRREQFKDEISRNGELKLIDISRPGRIKEEREKEKLKQERYKTKAKIRALQKQKAKLRRKRISLILTAGALAFGSYGAKKFYDYNLKPVTIEEALKGGKTLEELGLEQDNIDELNNIKLQLLSQEDLSRKDIQKLGQRIENFELEIIKDKLKNSLNISEELRVEPKTDTSDTIIYKFNNNGEIIEGLVEGKDYDIEIGDFIESIANLQTANNGYDNKINNRDEILQKLDKSLDLTERFASSEIIKNEKGKIKLNRTTRSDLEKIKENESKKVASIEDEGR